MNDFLIKIIIGIVVMVVFCFFITNSSFPSIKSEYDDIHLSEDIYNAGIEGVGETFEAIEKVSDEQEESIAEKMYTSVPEFFSELFSTLSEGLHSWEHEDLDVDGIKDDSKSLLEKFFDIFPYTE